MKPKEIVLKILSYESRVQDLRERAKCDKDYNYEERIDKLIKMQVGLIENFKKEACLNIAAKAWMQALKKANEPMSEKGFKMWYDEYIEITKQK